MFILLASQWICTGWPSYLCTLYSTLYDTSTEGVVSAQQDLKPESLCLSLICTHFNQHMCVNQSRVPNGFDLVVRLDLHQDQCADACYLWFEGVLYLQMNQKNVIR